MIVSRVIIRFKKHKIVILLFLLSLLSGIFWGHKNFFTPVPTSSDAGAYVCIAKDLLEKNSYTECGDETYREPGYPFFLAGIFYLAGYNADAVRFIQLLLFGISVILIYLIGKEVFSERVGVISGIISALFYGFASLPSLFNREILLLFLSVLLVFSLNRAGQTRNIYYFILSGLSIGVMTLTNASAQLLIVFVAATTFFIYRKKETNKKMLLIIITIFISFFFLIGPLIARNKIVYDKFGMGVAPRTGRVLVYRVYFMETMYPNISKYFFGHLFGYYFAEKIYPELDIKVFRDFAPMRAVFTEMQDQGYSYMEMDAELANMAKEKIIRQPHKYLLMSMLDFINFNSPIIPHRVFYGNAYVHHTFAEGRWPDISDYKKATILIAIRFFWYLFLFLVLFGIFKNIKNWDKISWLFLVILYFNLIYSALHAIPRYAIPVYPYYIIFAVYSLTYFYNKARHKIT